MPIALPDTLATPESPQLIPNFRVAKHEFLTAREVAVRLGYSHQRVYQLAEQNAIPHIRVGKGVRFPRRAFEEWLDQLNTRSLASVAAGSWKPIELAEGEGDGSDH